MATQKKAGKGQGARAFERLVKGQKKWVGGQGGGGNETVRERRGAGRKSADASEATATAATATAGVVAGKETAKASVWLGAEEEFGALERLEKAAYRG